MLQYDKDRAAQLAQLFTAQELDYLTDLVANAPHTDDPNQSRVEDILWKAFDITAQA